MQTSRVRSISFPDLSYPAYIVEPGDIAQVIVNGRYLSSVRPGAVLVDVDGAVEQFAGGHELACNGLEWDTREAK